jgi:hypothetical protein
MPRTHAQYKYSITIKSGDLAVVNCLRALSQYSQLTGNNRMPWSATGDDDWQRDDQAVTFRFTTPDYRAGFRREATRLLPTMSFEIVRESDEDSASPDA